MSVDLAIAIPPPPTPGAQAAPSTYPLPLVVVPHITEPAKTSKLVLVTLHVRNDGAQANYVIQQLCEYGSQVYGQRLIRLLQLLVALQSYENRAGRDTP